MTSSWSNNAFCATLCLYSTHSLIQHRLIMVLRVNRVLLTSCWRRPFNVIYSPLYFQRRLLPKRQSTWLPFSFSLSLWIWLHEVFEHGNILSMNIDKITLTCYHDDVIKWKHFPRYWTFVRGIHRSRWIPRTKASDAELWCFLWSAPE